MECPACKQETVAGARFCQHCGAALPPPSEEAGPPVEQPPPPPQASEWGGPVPQEPPPIPPPEGAEVPADRPTGEALFPDAGPGAGWVRALTLGTLAWVVMVLLAVVLAVAAFLDGISVIDAVKIGGMLFFAFHHVGVTMDFPTFDPTAVPGAEEVPDLGLGPIDISFTISVALLTGTFLALFLLYRAGRRAADDGGGSVGLRVVQGAAVGLPYAVLSSLLALVVGFDLEVPGEVRELLGATDELSVSVSPLSALLWPLGLGLVAGGLGGLSSARRMMVATSGLRLRAAASGAGLGVLLVLPLGFVGLLVLAGLEPDLTSSYLGLIGEGRSGLVLLMFTVLALGNIAVLGTVMGMGASIVVGEYLGATEHVASLLRFPQAIDPEALAGGVAPTVEGISPVEFATAPPGYFFFILVPLVAAVLAGRRASRRADAPVPAEGALVGGLAGVLWAAAVVFLGIMAGIGMEASIGIGGMVEAQGGYLGPDLLLGGGLALAWGVLGGAIGGAAGAGGAVPPPALEAPGPEGRPRAGMSGFEGMAQERYRAEESAAIPPEPAAEEEEEGEEEGRPSPEESAETPEPERSEARPQAPADSAFQFATPTTQYGTPPSTPEAPPEEEAPAEAEEGAAPMDEATPEEQEPRGREEDEVPPSEPPPRSPPPAPVPPPWERPAEETDRPPSGAEEPPPAPSEAPWAPTPEPEEERPEEPRPWARSTDQGEGAEETPPWAPAPEDGTHAEEPATPWGGPPERQEEEPAGEPEPWRPSEGEDREERPPWAPGPEPEGASEEPEGASEEQEEQKEQEERPPWMPPAPWPSAEDRPDEDGADQDARPPEEG